ncbi:EAL and HDOD domain-containing protein [Desulfonatronum sp. SC1]|uniref:EAL and HDOD domain-containing protein n=1 Tax=Desulfonatronum sp. SC1 TaxID=2109626 RepID=UPI000D31216C|nr:HDOD domain-containing protein [Desulfonatronum sp. SC1]PTN35037.1 diguanylate phosphodiesterase [Desulfonatronum sp. SC1]
MRPSSSTPPSAQSCFFARHPIFDRNMNLWGYQLLYRSDEQAESARFEDQDQATVQVVLEAATSPSLDLARDTYLLMEFSTTALLHEIPYALPPNNTIIKLTPGLCRDGSLPAVITKLRATGYRLALDGLLDSCRHLLVEADYLVVDALTESPEVFAQTMIAATRTGIPVLVKRVESPEAFSAAKSLGAELFLGFFFQKPETIVSKKLSSTQVARLKILKMLDNYGENWNEIAKILQNDVSLTYRLLRFLNSPFFGVIQPITTVQRAIAYLGAKQARTWLRMVILTDLSPPEKTSQLPLLSTQRARFLELTGSGRQDVNSDELFLLGLFSLLDAMFDMPMPTLVDFLPLADALKATLCGRPSPYAPWLELAVQFEQGRWARVDILAAQLELNPLQVGTCYAQAMTWAEEFFRVAR